jgi:hypothetical protein
MLQFSGLQGLALLSAALIHFLPGLVDALRDTLLFGIMVVKLHLGIKRV